MSEKRPREKIRVREKEGKMSEMKGNKKKMEES